MIIQKFYDQKSGLDVIQVQFRNLPTDLVLIEVEAAVRRVQTRTDYQPNHAPSRQPILACPMEVGEHDDHTHD